MRGKDRTSRDRRRAGKQSAVARLVAEGRATPACTTLDFKPIKLEGSYTASDALREVRGG